MKKNQMPQIGLPADACELSGFTDKDTLELHAADGVLIFMRDRMTALEVAAAIQSLSAIASDLTVTLATACGLCDNCGDVAGSDCGINPAECVAFCDLCSSLLDESQMVHVPDAVRQEAGIPMDARLEALADEDSGEIIVTESEIQRDITDVPPGILSVLAQSGVCLAELDELILREEIVYGK